eukprot:Pompholyxophrys_punicea_v1_NODE_740_length_1373_cov_2.514416.p3 type:complete len:105 gc:universal NODE_740_length_1373_cov_2.514416:756-1070(+)
MCEIFCDSKTYCVHVINDDNAKCKIFQQEKWADFFDSIFHSSLMHCRRIVMKIQLGSRIPDKWLINMNMPTVKSQSFPGIEAIRTPELAIKICHSENECTSWSI